MPKRTGIIARKLGMTRLFAEDGSHVPVTVLQVEQCQVVAVRTTDKDGYTALQLGAGKAKELIWTASRIDADESYRIGLCEQLVDPDTLGEAAAALAATIAALAGTAKTAAR